MVIHDVTYLDVCRLAEDEDRSQHENSGWPPAQHAQDSKVITPNFGANAIYMAPLREPVTIATRLVNIVTIIRRPRRTTSFPGTDDLLARTRTVRLSSAMARTSTGVPSASATPHDILLTSTPEAPRHARCQLLLAPSESRRLACQLGYGHLGRRHLEPV
jgi:hypothetical protein